MHQPILRRLRLTERTYRFWEAALPHLFEVVERLLAHTPSAVFIMGYQYAHLLNIRL